MTTMLGKRVRKESEQHFDQYASEVSKGQSKRAKKEKSRSILSNLDDPCDRKDPEAITLEPGVLDRAVKSAPTSNNGSNNLDPILDIQVQLPQDVSSGEGSEEDDLRRERR